MWQSTCKMRIALLSILLTLFIVQYRLKTTHTAYADTNPVIENLRNVEPFNRGREANALAEKGEDIIPDLIDAIENYYKHEDTQMVAVCILALHRMGPEARNATETLLNTLNTRYAILNYASARALGSIWAEEGEAENELVRDINTKLLSHTLTADQAEKYAPALALAEINNIPAPLQVRSVQSLEPLELSRHIYQWMMENEDRFLEVEKRPWPILVRGYLREPGSEHGQQAYDILSKSKPLDSIQFLYKQLLDIDPESQTWENIAELISKFTNVPLDAQEAVEFNDISGYLSQWRKEWYDKLKDLHEPEYRVYSWSELEKAIDSARFKAYPEDFDRLEKIQDVIIHQFDSAEQIPPKASEISRELLEKTLELKADITSSVVNFRDAEDIHEKIRLAQDILDLSNHRRIDEIGHLFLEDIADFAREESNERILSDFSIALSNIGEIPLRLSTDREERKDTLEHWLGIVSD